MFDLFKFKLPKAVTEQLIAKLEGIEATALTEADLERLSDFQRLHEMKAGVYVLYMDGVAVYAGKADKLFHRLKQHLKRIRGRRVLVEKEIRYKALLLDENWSTSANEDLLIKHFKEQDACEWNMAGFGPKDPGKNRDGGRPSEFDTRYPINTEWVVEGITDTTTVGEVLKHMKNQLPYTFRFKLTKPDLDNQIELQGVERTAIALARAMAKSLGTEFQFVVFVSHMVLYKSNKPYEHGTVLSVS